MFSMLAMLLIACKVAWTRSAAARRKSIAPRRETRMPSTRKSKRSLQHETTADQLQSTHRLEHIKQRLEIIEERLMKAAKFQTKTYFRYAFGLATAAVSVGVGYYLLGKPAKQVAAVQVADVISETLGQEQLQLQAQNVAKELVQALLDDKLVSRQAAQFIELLLARDDVRQSVVTMVHGVLRDDVVLQITSEQLTVALQRVLATPVIRDSALHLVLWVLAQDQTRESLTQLSVGWLREPAAVSAATRLAEEVVHDILENKAVKDHAIQFLNRLVQDKDVQQSAGVGIWQAVKWAVVPWGSVPVKPEAATVAVVPPAIPSQASHPSLTAEPNDTGLANDNPTQEVIVTTVIEIPALPDLTSEGMPELGRADAPMPVELEADKTDKP